MAVAGAARVQRRLSGGAPPNSSRRFMWMRNCLIDWLSGGRQSNRSGI
jgi:hypothetical protein